MQASSIAICTLLSLVLSAQPSAVIGWTSSPTDQIQAPGAAPATQPTPANPDTATPQETAGSSQDTASIGLYRPGAGTVVLAELTKSLDVAHLRVGDKVECTVIQDLLYKGKIIIPRGAKVRGRVTDAKARTKEQPESRLGITFDGIVLKDKKELPFQNPALIQAVASPIQMGSVPATRMNDLPIFMPKGSTTGGAAIDALSANASLAGANMPATSGAISAANRGVIGLAGLALDPASSVIVSRKNNVKLPYAAQVLLRVSDATQPK